MNQTRTDESEHECATPPVATAASPEPSQVLNNALELSSGIHRYNLPDLNAGDTLYVYAGAWCSRLDTVIRLMKDGEIVAENDDYFSENFNSALVYEILRSGDYLLELTSYSGNSQGGYELRVGINHPAVLEGRSRVGGSNVAFYDSTDSYDARSRRPVQVIDGRLSGFGVVIDDYELLQLRAGDTLYVYMDRVDSRIDPYIRLFSPDAQQLIADDDSAGNLNARFAYDISQDGNYHLEVLSCCGGSSSGRYRLTIGINENDVLRGNAEPTGDIITQDEANEKEFTPSVLTSADAFMRQESSHFYEIAVGEIHSGDRLYAYAEATSGNGTPQIELYVINQDIETITSGDLLSFGVSETVPTTTKATQLSQTLTPEYRYYVRVTLAPSNAGDRQTIGEYRLQVGLNRPDLIGEADAPADRTGLRSVQLKLNPQLSSTRVRAVEVFEGQFEYTEEVDLTASPNTRRIRLSNLGPGDTVYAYLEGTNGDVVSVALALAVPDYALDVTQNPVQWGNLNEQPVMMVYNIRTLVDEADLFISADIFIEGQAATYRLLVGVNTPEVLEGNAELAGSLAETAETSTPIEVGFELLQITEVNQKSENFSIVGILSAGWYDESLIFHPGDNDDNPQRQFSSLEDFTNVYPDTTWPEFVLTNQQSDREVQSQRVVVWSDGRIRYEERFAATLQATDFDFRKFPFDQQIFKLQVRTLFPETRYVLHAGQHLIGKNLGEEEWIVADDDTFADSESVDNFSEYTLTLAVNRQRNFYVLRILIPLGLIIGIGWAIQFIREYENRVTASGGNLLLFVAFNFTIADDLPRLGYLTFMDVLLLTAFLFAVIVFAFDVALLRRENVLIDKMDDDKDNPEYKYLMKQLARTDTWFTRLYPVVHVLALVIILQVFSVF